MARRDQPYLPLYVQDFLSDEKLAYCSAASTGVYIRLMCLMHKSEEYGKILLKQKFKQNDKQVKNFASQLAVQMPYDYHTILCALEELIDSKVLSEEPCALIQKRMVKDNEISELRASSGSAGGRKSSDKKAKKQDDFALNFAQAKVQANSENEIENEIENRKERGVGETKKCTDGIFESVENLKNRLLKTTWLEQVGMKQKDMPDEIRRLFEDFTDEIILKGDAVKTEKDFKSHFFNWLKLGIENRRIKTNEKPKRETYVIH